MTDIATTTTALTQAEDEERVHHESVVDSVIGSIAQLSRIGDASLKALRDKRLYRTTHSTFEDYCQDRFGITKTHANRRIIFAGILENLAPRGAIPPATERQARPLAKLETPEQQAQAWEEAQAVTGKDQPSAREVDEQVKALQSQLDLANTELDHANRQSSEWRKQAIEKEKARKAAEDAAVIKSNELRKLRESIEASANRIAEGKLSEIKATVSELEIGKIEMERKLKALRKEQDAQVETRTKQALQAQQDEINRREAQLRSMEARIETLRVTLSAVTEESRAVSHYEHITKEIRSTLDALSLHLTQAFDADYAAFMPAHFVHAFERLAGELDSGAKSVRSVLSQIEIRHIEGAINE